MSCEGNSTNIGGLDTNITGTQVMSGKASSSIPNGALGDFITLSALVNSGNDHFFYRLHRLDDASGDSDAYQVPNGFKFHVVKVIGSNPGVALNVRFGIGTATASFTNSSATIPTGAKWMAGYTDFYPFQLATPSAVSTLSVGSWDVPLVFDQNLFPFVQSTGGASVAFMIIGKLIAV